VGIAASAGVVIDKLTKAIAGSGSQRRGFLRSTAVLLAQAGELTVQFCLHLVQNEIEIVFLVDLVGCGWALRTHLRPLINMTVMAGVASGGFRRAQFADDRWRASFDIGSPEVRVFGKPGRTFAFFSC
jgi:hypothetical protein